VQNGWTTYGNGGVTIVQAVSYSSRTALSVTLTNSGSTNFFWFSRAQEANVWTSVSFYAASSANANSILVYFNGGYYQTLTLTPTWQLFTFTMAQFGTPATVGDKQLVFQNSGSATATIYLADVKLGA